MLSTSFEFRSKISDSSKVLVKATLTLADGTERELSGDDFVMGTMSFSEATSSGGKFDIGAATIGKFSATLNNYDRRFDEYDFTDSTIKPYIGVELDAVDANTGAHQVEWLAKGIFGVDQPCSYGNTIDLTALDEMRNFEVPYSSVQTPYPATLAEIVDDICTACGMTLKNLDFENGDLAVHRRPDDESLSCLQVIAYAAQMSGNFAKCDTAGRLVLSWYDTSAFEGEDWLDGEAFDDDTPYSSGDTADGGDFLDYSSGDVVEGGYFEGGPYASVWSLSSMTVLTDDVVVTGLKVTASDQILDSGSRGEDGETAYYPVSNYSGYVLEIEGNPLVQYGQASTVARRVGSRVVGMQFRPFDLSAVGNPAIEAGDAVIVTDRLQNQYRSFVTSTTYKVGNYQAISCNAETPSRNRAATYSAMTRAVVEARNAVKAERTSRELAQAVLARQLAASAGLYSTEEVQEDGSVVLYMHDKSTLAQSNTIWKATANAFGVSTDGGASYLYGVDSNGVAILNRIYAVGINADYITTGSFTVKKNGATIFKADVDAGTVQIDAAQVLVGTRQAFANDHSSVIVNSGTVCFNSNTFQVRSTYFKVASDGRITATGGTIGGFTITDTSIFNDKMTLDGLGLALKNDSGTRIGYIGTNKLVLDSSKYGLTFDLETAGAYMAWAAKENSSDSYYDVKLVYANKRLSMDSGYWTAGRLHVACDSSFHDYKAYNFWIDPNTGGASGGISGKMAFVQVTSMGSNGIASYWYPNSYLTFKNGLLIGASAHWS